VRGRYSRIVVDLTLNNTAKSNKVEKLISSAIPSFQSGPSQIEALNWPADDDPANLDFELVSPDELLERFVTALLYFSMGARTGTIRWGFFRLLPCVVGIEAISELVAASQCLLRFICTTTICTAIFQPSWVF
jgi:hypothetical protein